MKQLELGVLAGAMLLAVSCEGYVGARGRVTTSGGSPLAGATIVLDGPGYPERWRTESGSDGCFRLGRTEAPNHATFAMTVSKEGFQPVTVSVQGGDTSSEFAVELVATMETSQGKSVKGLPGSVGCDWVGMSEGTDAFYNRQDTK
jgi:hypothetical protein